MSWNLASNDNQLTFYVFVFSLKKLWGTHEFLNISDAF